MQTTTQYSNKFAVKTEAFEGPMELLIELVEKRKLLINDISLAEVTDEYMRRVSEMQEASLPNTAQFVNLAATLLLIKSKSLLPILDLSEDEETDIEDLEERLRKYQIYRDAGIVMSVGFGKKMLYEPEYTPPREPLFVPDSYCNLTEISNALERVLYNLPKTPVEKPRVKVRPTITLEEMMDTLRKRIENQVQTKFSEIRAREPEHKNVIVGFLAILELFKQGNIIITQSNAFDDIHMEMEEQVTPKYY